MAGNLLVLHLFAREAALALKCFKRSRLLLSRGFFMTETTPSLGHGTGHVCEPSIVAVCTFADAGQTTRFACLGGPQRGGRTTSSSTRRRLISGDALPSFCGLSAVRRAPNVTGVGAFPGPELELNLSVVKILKTSSVLFTAFI